MRKICVIVGSRANYSSAKPIMQAIKARPDLTLQVICYATAILDRFGNLDADIERDGFTIDERIHTHIEGETPVSMVKSTGLALIEIGTALGRLNPDFVVVIGDRYEVMSGAIAAAYLNIPLAHTMGGEVTGTIDESIRHAITKLAHVHFPANDDAAQRIIRMGEDPKFVFNVGCPRNDIVREILEKPFTGEAFLQQQGVGGQVDINADFLLFSLHPVTTEMDALKEQTNSVLDAIEQTGLPTIGLWPNSDAGAGIISSRVRSWRESGKLKHVRFFKNLPLEIYVHLMARTKCLVGNSSSGIREGAFIGTPVVNIGTRQHSRLRAENVKDVPYDVAAIREAIAAQVAHRNYGRLPLYGDGKACEKIANILAETIVPVQKTIMM